MFKGCTFTGALVSSQPKGNSSNCYVVSGPATDTKVLDKILFETRNSGEMDTKVGKERPMKALTKHWSSDFQSATEVTFPAEMEPFVDNLLQSLIAQPLPKLTKLEIKSNLIGKGYQLSHILQAHPLLTELHIESSRFSDLDVEHLLSGWARPTDAKQAATCGSFKHMEERTEKKWSVPLTLTVYLANDQTMVRKGPEDPTSESQTFESYPSTLEVEFKQMEEGRIYFGGEFIKTPTKHSRLMLIPDEFLTHWFHYPCSSTNFTIPVVRQGSKLFLAAPLPWDVNVVPGEIPFFKSSQYVPLTNLLPVENTVRQVGDLKVGESGYLLNWGITFLQEEGLVIFDVQQIYPNDAYANRQIKVSKCEKGVALEMSQSKYKDAIRKYSYYTGKSGYQEVVKITFV